MFYFLSVNFRDVEASGAGLQVVILRKLHVSMTKITKGERMNRLSRKGKQCDREKRVQLFIF